MKRRKLNKKEQKCIAVKNFLTLKGFKGDQQAELADLFISIHPGLGDKEDRLGYLIKNFKLFINWLDKLLQTVD